jgi:hypothetical protein
MDAPFLFLLLVFGLGKRRERERKAKKQKDGSEFLVVASSLSLPLCSKKLSLPLSKKRKRNEFLTPDRRHLCGNVEDVPDAGGRPERHGVHPCCQDSRGGEFALAAVAAASDAAAAAAAAAALCGVFGPAAPEAPPGPRPRNVRALLDPIQDDAAECNSKRISVLRQNQLRHMGQGGRGRDALRLRPRRRREG